MGPSKKYNTCIMITAQKMKLSINEAFPFNEAFHFRRKLQIWSHLLKKSLMENFIFCEVDIFHPIHLCHTLSILFNHLPCVIH